MVMALGKKIFIVDDETELVHMAKRKLERNGYEVNVAYNGEEALHKVHEEDFDLIVTDVVMPVMDGFTFYKNLKDSEKTAHVPVIVLTARSNLEGSFQALGVADFLSKPFDGERLLNKVAQVVAQPRKLPVKKKVLIAGSEELVTKEMQQVLGDMGTEAVVVEDELDLLKQAHKIKPDIILLDVQLKELKTAEMIQALRSFDRFKDFPIVTFSNVDSDELDDLNASEDLKDAKNECMIAGASKYLGRFTQVSFLDGVREYGL